MAATTYAVARRSAAVFATSGVSFAVASVFMVMAVATTVAVFKKPKHVFVSVHFHEAKIYL